MGTEAEIDTGLGPVLVPGVVSLAASSRRTLKHGDTFAVFDELGDVLEAEHTPGGIFHFDTRHLSRLSFTLEGHRPLVLSSTVQADNLTLDVDLTNPDLFQGDRLVMPKDTFHVARTKFLWKAGCYELFTLTSYDERRRRFRIGFDFGADFADLFEVRGHRRRRRGETSVELRNPAEVAFLYRSLDGITCTTVLCFDPAPTALSAGAAAFELELAPRERRAISLRVLCSQGAEAARAEKAFFTALRRARAAGRQQGAGRVAIETSNEITNGILSRSSADLAMLMTDTEHGRYPYAGVPWFSTVFGRDGLLTALQTLWLDPALARGVLAYLAAHQAQSLDGAADREPGKILHERRRGELARLGEIPFGAYYGSIDSTPLFVALAGLYWHHTGDRGFIESIWPNVRAALEWIDRYGDRDGDGFVEYGRRLHSGLRNQGWKDSEDSVFHADGELARGPIALCEVQGYVYLARRSAALLAADLGERALAKELEEQAELLRARFEASFWDEELGTYALALDGEKKACRVRTSNPGQLLFTGMVQPERARRLVAQLFGREFFCGWGIRTLSAREKRFNPTSYHNGSVWPHDNALFALGLAHYGHTGAAVTLATALFDAASQMHLRRLPELFCGFRRQRGKAPTLYPVACAPQAWAAVAPFALLQACLALDIDAVSSTLTLRQPRLPEFLDWVAVRGLRVGESRLDLMLYREEQTVAVKLLQREGEAEVVVVH